MKGGQPAESQWAQLADDIAVMSFPLRAFGIDFKRNVTLLRLSDERVIIHSTAPFTAESISAIQRFGEPAWIVEATLMHDTFARQAQAAFPNLPYLAPNGFARAATVQVSAMLPPPTEWKGEIDVLEIDGTRTKEHVLFHRRSRTLVVADLFFSFPAETIGWPRLFVRHVMRLPRMFGISAFFRFLVIRDRDAFARSIRRLLEWQFERVVVAHWKTVEADVARFSVERALGNAGFPGQAATIKSL